MNQETPPTLSTLAQQHFAQLPAEQRVSALIRLLDALDNDTLRLARIERHARPQPERLLGHQVSHPQAEVL